MRNAYEVPVSIRDLSSLPRIDYADAFTVSTALKATPENSARALFGDTPDFAERLIWKGFLGLRLSRGASPDTVAGWRVTERGTDWIRLRAASWFLTCDLVVQATGGQLWLGTFLHYRNPLGRAVWTTLSALHRRLAPGLLHGATERVRTL